MTNEQIFISPEPFDGDLYIRSLDVVLITGLTA
jgi:hypothetical protein